ncbi:MAG: permease [Prevotellaceae bacterium]|jgi:uncharacterized membrane protein YraQ (UPF0718 family)|nr:permease [Prevotellaceae bacterium]
MNYITPFISLLNEMSPYLLFGFLIAGILKVYVPKEMYISHISKPTFRSALWAAIAGVPLPLCSCGVIPTGLSLHKEGASKGATVSFLISTPQTGVDSIAATYSLLGLPFALLRPLAAFITGIVGGAATNKLSNTVSPTDIYHDDNKTAYHGKNRLLQVLHYAFAEMIQDIGKWLIIGILIAGLIAVFVPDSFFAAYLNNPLLNMFIVLAVAVPTYTCATGSIPLAAVLMMKGLTPGAALVFLMAGPATSIASITVIGKALGKRTLLVYLCSIIAGAITFGLIVDYLLPASWFNMSRMNHDLLHTHHHDAFSWLKTLSSVLLTGLLINAFIQKHRNSKQIKNMNKKAKVYKVGGMTCNHCKTTVENGLAKVEGVVSVQADLAKSAVYVEGTHNDESIKKIIEELGFEYKGRQDPAGCEKCQV